MLSKLKSKKKKNKQNILIAYNKSIASMQGIELAMLFCHAGFSVKTILLDGAEEQISSELLKEITGHAPWSKLHKPNWVKADIKYPVAVIFDGKIPLNSPLTQGIVGMMYSPLVGVKYERIKLGNMRLDIGAEWLAGHLFMKDVKAAAGGSLNIEVPFAEMEKVKLNMNIGVRDKLFLKDSGIENRASVILAIGVENVIR